MIISEFPAKVLRVNGTPRDLDVQVTLTYDEEDEPFAIRAIFEEEGAEDVIWIWGRELMINGASSYFPVGHDGVKFQYKGHDSLIMCLSSPQGHTDVQLPQGLVLDFLNETTAAVPLGEETIDSELDTFLAEVLGG